MKKTLFTPLFYHSFKNPDDGITTYVLRRPLRLLKWILKKKKIECEGVRLAPLLIAKDDFPLETFKGRPITNFVRKILHGSHFECHQCYEKRKGIKVTQ